MRLDGIKLKTMILKRGISQWQVARTVGIHEATLSKVIHGRVIVKQAIVRNIAKFLKVPAGDLLT